MKKLLYAIVIAATWSQSAHAACICNHLPCPCHGIADGPYCPSLNKLFCPIQIDPLNDLLVSIPQS